MKKDVIPTNKRLLKKVSKNLVKGLKKADVAEDIVFDIYVSLQEALRNAMIHGNKLNGNKKIVIETELSENVISICVEDEGKGFNTADLPDPTLNENLLRKSGRGVYLIKHLMDEVKFEKGGRRIVLKKYLDKKHL